MIRRMINDPDAFSRTTRTLGADSAHVEHFMLQSMLAMEQSWSHRIQVIVWPAAASTLLILIIAFTCKGRRKRRHLRSLNPNLLSVNNSDAYAR